MTRHSAQSEVEIGSTRVGEVMTRAIGLIGAMLLLAACGNSDTEPNLLNISQPRSQGPDEFAILPNKPLQQSNGHYKNNPLANSTQFDHRPQISYTRSNLRFPFWSAYPAIHLASWIDWKVSWLRSVAN